jgi:RimJ/RimL family protein N-acetyltransferase
VEAFDLALRDGRSVRIRAAEVGDEAEYLQAFERMSQDARYMRFMRFVREPDIGRLHQMLASFPEAGIGIVATVQAPDGIDIVGSTIAVFDDDRIGCEFAVTVAADFGGVGLATALMKSLMAEARRRGLRQMHGYVLAVNRSMLALAKGLGFSIAPDPDDGSVRICRIDLDRG